MGSGRIQASLLSRTWITGTMLCVRWDEARRMSRAAARVVLSLASACAQRPNPPPTPVCASCDVGLTCLPAGARTGCRESARALLGVDVPDSGGSTCRYDPSRPLASDALVAGFQVAEFNATYSPDHPEELTFDPPAASTMVACALFACTPVVARDADWSGDPTSHITNFDACALSMEPFPGTRRSFSVKDGSHARTCNSSEAICGPIFDLLQAGCWAYDATHIVGATRLLTVDPSATFLWTTQIVADCSADNEGLACALGGTSLRAGACFQGKCAPHCQTAEDCQVQLVGPTATVARGDAGDDAGSGPQCGYTCEAFDLQKELGVCKPVSP